LQAAQVLHTSLISLAVNMAGRRWGRGRTLWRRYVRWVQH